MEPYLDAKGHLIPEEAWRSFVDGLVQVDGSERVLSERVLSERVLSERVPFSPEGKRRLLQELQALLENAVRRRIPCATASAAAGAIGRGFLRASDSVSRPEHPRGSQGGDRGGAGARVGLLFSGGVDSTLIAFLLKRFGVPFTCITVGFQDGRSKEPEDITESRRIAKEIGFDHVVVLLDLERMHCLVKKIISILGPELTNIVNVGVGSVEVAAIEKGNALGIDHFFGGLGSEELFAGYDRHERALESGGLAALHEECLAGLQGMYRRDLLREAAIAKALDVTVATPFLDEELTRFSLAIPTEYKINMMMTFTGRARGDIPDKRTVKKLILREAAELMGLPRDIAFRPKRAAQYGSRTNNALAALARANGFRHKDEYLRSLVA